MHQTTVRLPAALWASLEREAFMSTSHHDPDLSAELFILDGETGELDQTLDVRPGEVPADPA